MRFRKYLFYAFLGGLSLAAVGATLTNVGVARADQPEGKMLRQESASGPGFFHSYRSHRGGGLRSGK